MKKSDKDEVFGENVYHAIIFFALAVSLLAILFICVICVCYRAKQLNSDEYDDPQSHRPVDVDEEEGNEPASAQKMNKELQALDAEFRNENKKASGRDSQGAMLKAIDYPTNSAHGGNPDIIPSINADLSKHSQDYVFHSD